MKQKETIIMKYEDFLKETIPLLSNFPKKYRFILADKIQHLLLDTFNNLIQAYYSGKEKKKVLLPQINIDIEKSRHLFRLCHSFKIFTFPQYERISVKTNEIGKMVGAWNKSLYRS